MSSIVLIVLAVAAAAVILLLVVGLLAVLASRSEQVEADSDAADVFDSATADDSQGVGGLGRV